jgi:hypothetical protein
VLRHRQQRRHLQSQVLQRNLGGKYKQRQSLRLWNQRLSLRAMKSQLGRLLRLPVCVRGQLLLRLSLPVGLVIGLERLKPGLALRRGLRLPRCLAPTLALLLLQAARALSLQVREGCRGSVEAGGAPRVIACPPGSLLQVRLQPGGDSGAGRCSRD